MPRQPGHCSGLGRFLRRPRLNRVSLNVVVGLQIVAVVLKVKLRSFIVTQRIVWPCIRFLQ